MKKVAGVVATIFVYDAMGQLVAEYSSEAPTENGTQYLTADSLGSPRVITGADGLVKGRHDYLPFGEEIGADVGGRTGKGYSQPDGVRQGFIGYEKDGETGLNYAQERYYSSSQGRFTSVDPLMASAKTGNPQTWNRFVYVLNNPLRYTDPDGMKPQDAWSQLTAEEQKIIAGKLSLGIARTNPLRQETPQEAFNRLIGSGSKQEIESKILTVKNFIDSAGGHSNSEVWQGIGTIESVALQQNRESGGIEGRLTFLVTNRQDFLQRAERNGYDKNRYYEVAADHPNNSLRQRTPNFGEPGIHFANDDSTNLNRFYAHWDRVSSAFDRGWDYTPQKEALRALAGRTHNNPYSPQELRQELKRTGIVPRNEP